MASPGMAPLTVIRIPEPVTGRAPDQPSTRLRSERIWVDEVSPRATAALTVSRWRSRVAISSRSWLLRVVTLATSSVSSGDGQRGQALVGGLRVELGDGEDAQDEQHGRHGQLRGPAPHQGVSVGASLAATPGDGDASTRP